jgi:competence protein ComEC
LASLPQHQQQGWLKPFTYRRTSMKSAAAGVLAGAALVAVIPALPAIATSSAILSIGLALSILKRLGIVGCIAAGFGLTSLAGGLALSDRLAADLEGRDILLEGVVADIPSGDHNSLRFVFRALAVQPGYTVPRRIRVSWYGARVVPAAGERWQLLVRLKRPVGSINPGGFDYEKWLLQERIGAIAYVRRSNKNQRLAPSGKYSLLSYRSRLASRIDALSAGNPFLGVLKALTIGYRGDLSPSQKEVFRRTGTGHLLAISGLHIGIAAILGVLLARLLWHVTSLICPGIALALCRKTFSSGGGLLAAGAYAALAGFSLPTRRALVMLLVVVVLTGLRRRTRATQAFSIALVAVVLLQPLAVLSAGFWLSFTAVAGLIAGFSGQVMKSGRVHGAIRSQLLVWFALLVPTVLIFGGVPLVAPFVNLILVPLFAVVIVPVALLATLLLAVSSALARIGFTVVFTLLELSWPLLQALATSGVAGTRGADVPLFAMLLAIVGTVSILIPRAFPGRLAAPLLIIPALSWSGIQPGPGEFELTVLDVGQGLSAIVRTHSRTLVFDAGPAWYGGGDAGTRIVAPFLQSRGIGKIDMLVVSHGDNDHRGGAIGLLGQIPAVRILTGPGVDLPGVATERCHQGLGWEWDGLQFRFLNPSVLETKDGNNSSCVLRVTGNNASLLLAGDIERKAETSLLASGMAVTSDVVVAPHHGSATSSTARFVSATAARWVIFPAGRNNRWGFPHPDVRLRWQAAGAMTWSTGEAGAVRVFFDNAGVAAAPIGWRCQSRRFWRMRSC